MICYLIRHGKDDDSVRGGWSKTPLTAEGIEQVNGLAHLLVSSQTSISQIFTSDLPRAKQTAEILSDHLHVPVIEMPAFRETNNGILAGIKNDLANILYPGLYYSSLAWDEAYPGGESPHMFFTRIFYGWNDLKEKLKRDRAGDVALVTHAGVINVILCIEARIQYTNQEIHFPIKNAQMIKVEI